MDLVSQSAPLLAVVMAHFRAELHAEEKASWRRRKDAKTQAQVKVMRGYLRSRQAFARINGRAYKCFPAFPVNVFGALSGPKVARYIGERRDRVDSRQGICRELGDRWGAYILPAYNGKYKGRNDHDAD
jgi:hypothetical protein